MPKPVPPSDEAPVAAPVEITVREFAEEKQLEAWQVRALLARSCWNPFTRKPRAEIEAALHDALHGRV